MHPVTDRGETPPIQLVDLLPGDDPETVWAEVMQIVGALAAPVDGAGLQQVFVDVVSLYRGEYPGYRACNTPYHDLGHTLLVLLAMARIMDGAAGEGIGFTGGDIALGLTAALMHDTGYIQDAQDQDGTGAKYTLTHVDRSVAFARAYVTAHPSLVEDGDALASVIRCTDLHVSVGAIAFRDGKTRLLGLLLGTADLLGQMADRLYLEKLLYLYGEFVEGGIEGYASEFDLLKKTRLFYERARKRFAGDLRGVDRFMGRHFQRRWGIDRDLYARSVAHNVAHLDRILERHRNDYATVLRRGGIVERIGGKRNGPSGQS